jgi:hypothetical protein
MAPPAGGFWELKLSKAKGPHEQGVDFREIWSVPLRKDTHANQTYKKPLISSP